MIMVGATLLFFAGFVVGYGVGKRSTPLTGEFIIYSDCEDSDGTACGVKFYRPITEDDKYVVMKVTDIYKSFNE